MSKVVYCVEVEGSMEHYSDIREVAAVLGVEKITKKDIKSGKYPQVSIASAEVIEPMDGVEELIQETELLAEVDEPYQPNQHEVAAILAIDGRMNSMADDLDHSAVELYDELNRIKLIIETGAGDSMSEQQHLLLVETMTGAYKQDEIVYDDPNDDGRGIESIAELKEALIQAGIDPDVQDDGTPADNSPALTNIASTNKQKLADQDIEYPEVGSFKEDKYLKRFYKQLSDEQLDEWVALEGLSYKECEHPSINRMRKCMAIKELHFPTKTKVNTKSKSKYSHYTTEQLVEMATKAGIKVRDSKGSDQILRMYTIMDLRKAGLIV